MTGPAKPTEDERKRAGYWWEAHGAVDDPGERNGYAHGLAAANRTLLNERKEALLHCADRFRVVQAERDQLRAELDEVNRRHEADCRDLAEAREQVIALTNSEDDVHAECERLRACIQARCGRPSCNLCDMIAAKPTEEPSDD